MSSGGMIPAHIQHVHALHALQWMRVPFLKQDQQVWYALGTTLRLMHLGAALADEVPVFSLFSLVVVKRESCPRQYVYLGSQCEDTVAPW